MYNAYPDMIATFARQVDGPILFRPLPKNPGDWLWWGTAGCDADPYRELYRYTVEYLRDKARVHNMLYDYSPSGDIQSEEEYAARYPGDAYVDILGFGLYHADGVQGDGWMDKLKHTLEIVDAFAAEHGKLTAVAEIGVKSTQPFDGSASAALQLEGNLGCTLFVRGRGKRQVELTSQGRAFVPVAEKWRLLWQEAREVTGPGQARALRAASVGSLSTYLLPPVFRDFLAPGRALTFHNYHSREAYEYVAQGLVDTALISDHMSHPQVETVPAFRSAMMLVSGSDTDWPDTVHPSALDPAKELRLPWNPEYDLWHSFWFSAAAVPRAVLDQMSLLEEFFSWRDSWPDSWAIVPAVAAVPLKQMIQILYGRPFMRISIV